MSNNYPIISVKEDRCSILTSDHKLYTLNHSYFNNLHRNNQCLLQPTTIILPPQYPQDQVIAILPDTYYSKLLTREGRLYSLNNLLLAKSSLRDNNNSSELPVSPVIVRLAHKISQISRRYIRGLFVTPEGQLHSYDDGCVDIYLSAPNAGLIQVTTKIAAISAGFSHSALITDQGQLYTFGCNNQGQLGLGDYEERLTPTLVILTSKALLVSASIYHTALVTEAGQLYTFGSGILGQGDRQERLRPSKVSLPDDERVIAVSTGCKHTVALTESGKLYAFGYGGFGALGNTDGRDCLLPTRIELPNQALVKQVVAGATCTLMVTEENEIFVCGGQIVGSKTAQMKATLVMKL